MKIGRRQHEIELEKAKKQLTEEGYRVIDLKGVSPDAIAIKNGKVIAVEVLGRNWRFHKTGKNRKKPYRELHASWTYDGKEKTYAMFDGVRFFEFIRENIVINDSKVTKEILSKIENSKKPYAVNEMWKDCQYVVSQRRIRDILEQLYHQNKIGSNMTEHGRRGRFRIYFKLQ